MKKNKIQYNLFTKTYLTVSLPLFCCIFFLIFATYSYDKTIRSAIQNSYVERMESLCLENNSSIQNIITTIRTLSENDVFSSENINSSTTTADHNLFREIMNNNHLLDSLVLYDRQNNIVHGYDGSKNAISYFEQYKYVQYQKSFFDTLAEGASNTRMLQPSLVSMVGDQKLILPIVFYSINNCPSSIIIANLDLSSLIERTNQKKLTKNSEFVVINSHNKNVFNADNSFTPIRDTNFYNNFRTGSHSFCYTINNVKSMIITYQPDNSFYEYIYATIVPYKDISNSVISVLFTVLAIALFSIFILFVVTYLCTRHIYSPIQKLTEMIQKKPSPPKQASSWKYILDSVSDLIEQNNSLQSNISSTLPILDEYKLIDFLNSNDYYMVEPSINFKYEYFCSVLIVLKPLDTFYATFDSSQYHFIKDGLRSTLNAIIGEKFDFYNVPSDSDTLYIILNLENNVCKNDIESTLDTFNELLKFDTSYITVNTAIGNIYKGLSGLKKSHKEINSITNFSRSSQIKIQSKNQINIDLETALINNLISRNIHTAKEQINTALTSSLEYSNTTEALYNTYSGIIDIIFKVMNTLSIEFSPEQASNLNLSLSEPSSVLSQMLSIIDVYLDMIKVSANIRGAKCSIKDIAEYINENYANDICLDSLASQFELDAKYISKAFKTELGINFLDYLARIRINKSKELLKDSSLSINDIFPRVGFLYRTSFVRTFKKLEGISPSEYRKNISWNNGE